MRLILLVLILSSCGLKGDPLPVEEPEEERVSL